MKDQDRNDRESLEEIQAETTVSKNQTEQKQHKRRVRYKGTHPRSYQEKYKELQPEKYPETVEKVIQKGGTPVGMHISICVKEILDFLQIQPGQKGLDATLGYGGHTKEMLKCLQGQGHLYALDVDPIESVKTKERLEKAGYGEEILTIRQMNFADIDQIAREAGPFDFVLADLGVSSMQIDNPERGFTYKKEGPLDLRLNPQKGVSAAERLKEVTEEELAGMLWENSDEPYAEEIAATVMEKLRKGEPVETTIQLQKAIEEALSFLPEREQKEAVKKSCQRTFQALRIDVNSEFEVLYAFMEKLRRHWHRRKRWRSLHFIQGRPDRKEGLQRAEASRDLQRDRSGCHPSFSGECIRTAALVLLKCAGQSRGKRIIVMIYSSRKGRDFYGKEHLKIGDPNVTSWIWMYEISIDSGSED